VALTAYQTQLSALIQAPNSPVALVPTATQTLYINAARKQLAADAECVRAEGQLVVSVGVQNYDFSAITTIPGAGDGFGDVITVRAGYVGTTPLEIRPWEWFQKYYLPKTDTDLLPRIMSQRGQGVNGTLWFYPIPDFETVVLDVGCLPIDLTNDATPEAIPALWTDAVPFYAAWLAMQQLQRQADAETMMQRYKMLSQRGRQLATPTELPDNLPGGRGAQMAAGRSTLSGQPQTNAR
jgi:hypothetical protein